MSIFGFFRAAEFQDQGLGRFQRSRGRWRGVIFLDDREVPLLLSGSCDAPDSAVLQFTRSFPSQWPTWQVSVEQALFEHYRPYAEGVAAGEIEPPETGAIIITEPKGVRPFAKVEYIDVTSTGQTLDVEIGYRVDWDEEHTLGACFRDGKMLGMNGSVRMP